MGPRVKLFQTERQAASKTIHMVLEDMQTAMLEIEASAAENPNIAPVNTPQEEALLEVVIVREEQEMEAVGEVVDASLPAIGALEDTAYAIAPAIQSTRSTDLAMVRQIANTAADTLGVPAEELLVGVDDSVIGQPLVLEGFQEKALAAARAVWNAILNFLDRSWTLFQSNFRRTSGRLKKLKDVSMEIGKNAQAATIKPTATMVAMVEGDSLAATEVIKGVDNLINFLRLAMGNINMSKDLYGKIISIIGQAKTAQDIPRRFNEAAGALLTGFTHDINNSPIFKIEGDDMVSIKPLNGNIIVLKGLGAVQTSLKSDPLKAAGEFASVVLEGKEFKQDLSPVEYTPSDFQKVAIKLGDIYKEIGPNAINHLGGITRERKRNVQTMADKVVSDWSSLIAKAEAGEQAALRPYLSAISQMVNKHVNLSTQLYKRAIGTMDAGITAHTQLLEQGVAGKKDGKKED